MIDPNYIHQRDVSTILTNLQSDVNNVREKYAENPNDPQMAIELQALIDNADRDLRLKTQAIVRARLSQSRILPIQSKSIPIPELPPRSQSVACTAPPLPPLQAAPSDYEPNNMHRRGIGNKNAHPPQPIPPIAHEKHSKRSTTPISKEKVGRSKRIPQLKESLPRVDRRDPLATPPPISENLINTFGLEQLNETGLIKNNDIRKHLEGIVTVAPYTYELPPVPLSVSPNYVLDTSNQDNSEIGVRPNTRNIPPSSIEEFSQSKEDKNEVSVNSSESNRSNGSESTENEQDSMKFYLINGIPDEDSFEFINFKRSSYKFSETVDVYLDLLRQFCENRGLKKQQIDGQKLIELAMNFDPDELSDDRLLRCMIGDMKKVKKAGRFGFGFTGKDAEKKAAIAIQSIWRGFIARRMVRLIKRSLSAAKKIQNWYKHKIDSHKFFQSMKNAKKERYQSFLNLQKTDFYYPNQPHILLHIIDGHLPSELGRIQALATNPNATLAILSRFPLPTVIASYLKDHVKDQEKLVFVIPRQRLPYTLPIEDVLASDSRLMSHIQEIANERPIYLTPNKMRETLIDACVFMESFLLAPLPKSLEKVTGILNNLHFLSLRCKNMFVSSNEEVHNRDELCETLANLALSNLDTQQWIIRTNSGNFGWIDTNEILMFERIRKNASIMTKEDLDDPTFRGLLKKSVSDELNVVTNTISKIKKNELLDEVCSKGAVVVAAPQNITSRPSVSLFVMAKKTKNRKIASKSKQKQIQTENEINQNNQNENKHDKIKPDANNQSENENKQDKIKPDENNQSENENKQDKIKQDENNQSENENIRNENGNKKDEDESEIPQSEIKNDENKVKLNDEDECKERLAADRGEEEEDEYEGEVRITGTWENLYISEFERFATIHPAFLVKPDKLRKRALKYSDELVKRRLIGSSVIDFWSSSHKGKDRLTPDQIEFTATERCLPQMLSENVCKLSFNEKTMKMGRYTYVQERLVLPYEMPSSEFNSKCVKNGIKLNKNVFFLPDLQEEITIGFVAVADTPELLINLVYETLCILSEKVFDLKDDPKALLFSYCTAIEYIKEQIDSGSGISSTVFMKKMKIKIVEDKVEPLLFKLEEFNKKNRDDRDTAFKETPKVKNDEKISENNSETKTNSVKIFDINYDPESRRSLITTPIDIDGRERKLITTSDEEIQEPNSAKSDMKSDDKSETEVENVKEDLPDAPAGANIPEESLESNSNQPQTRIEGDDDEILTEEAQTPRSDDEE